MIEAVGKIPRSCFRTSKDRKNKWNGSYTRNCYTLIYFRDIEIVGFYSKIYFF